MKLAANLPANAYGGVEHTPLEKMRAAAAFVKAKANEAGVRFNS